MDDIMTILSKLLRRNQFRLRFIRRGPGWLQDRLPDAFGAPLPPCPLVEQRAAMTQQAGAMPLWSRYAEVTGYPRSTARSRSPDEVRIGREYGELFAWIVEHRPGQVVEFGAAFGVSGMFWLAGIERAGAGHLHSFEPNAEWAAIARQNLGAVSARFTLTVGTFEANGPAMLEPQSVDLAFVDAIHTEAFVMTQWALLRPLMKPGGLVLFDDIDFSPEMLRCWKQLANQDGLRASAAIGTRLGIVELE